jgi:hypothetical protein
MYFVILLVEIERQKLTDAKPSLHMMDVAESTLLLTKKSTHPPPLSTYLLSTLQKLILLHEINPSSSFQARNESHAGELCVTRFIGE